MKFNLSFGDPFTLCRSRETVPVGEVFVIEHLFGIDCYFPLQIYFVVDDWVTIYMNGEQVCSKGGYRNLNNCPIYSESVVRRGCGERNLTIVVTNRGIHPSPANIAYQLDKKSKQIAITHVQGH